MALRLREPVSGSAMHCPLLQKITIGAGLEELGERCFAECNDIKSFSISQDNPAFCSVSGAVVSGDKKCLIRVPPALLGAYSVPEGIARITYDAFLEAEQLEEIKLPASVETIENLTFGSCNSLKRISVDSKNQAFSGEKEYRIAIILDVSDIESRKTIFSSESLKNLKLDYCERNGVFSPHLELQIKKNAVKKITISPTIEREIAESSLRERLVQKDYSAEISVSEIPIRF